MTHEPSVLPPTCIHAVRIGAPRLDPAKGVRLSDFWQRLKQRKLVQWVVAYVAFAFALLQGIDAVAQQFGWPESVRRGITLALAIGFCVMLVLAWYHGERGAQRMGGAELLIIALLLAIGGGLLWRYARVPPPAAATAVVAKAASSVQVTEKPPDLLAAVAAKTPEKSVAVLPFVNVPTTTDAVAMK